MIPTAPIRLMIAFPLERSGFGVTSGISDTAGERKIPIDSSVQNSAATNRIRFRAFAAAGSSSMKMTAKIVPTKINGVRLPRFVLILSDHAPKNGSRNSARMLSSAMMPPDSVSPIWKVYFKINGMMLSYTCQKALIARNANPIKMVRLLSSFMMFSLVSYFVSQVISIRSSALSGRCKMSKGR